MHDDDSEFHVGTILKVALAGMSLVAILIAGCAGCTYVRPGYIGIKVNKTGTARGAQDLPLITGYNLINPFLSTVVEYPTYMQTVKWTKNADEGKPVDESLTFTSKDSMIVNADVSLSYLLHANKAASFYVRFRADDINTYTDGYLRNVVRDAFNEQAGGYTVEQIMGDNAPLLAKVMVQVQSKAINDGIEINQLGFIGAPRPPQIVLDAINSKVQAEQIGLQKQNELVQSEADAKKAVAKAQGEADAAVATAKGQADANKLITSTLTPELVEFIKIQKWDGHLSQVQAGGGGVIVDVGKR
jgi:regulator of protease activity HflC (stomatin/prohibitin superfamily)